jgi:hypothetical protein
MEDWDFPAGAKVITMQGNGTSGGNDAIRKEWVDRLNRLVDDVEEWGRSLDWATRRIDKPMNDETIGPYRAPGLLMQREFTRIILDPISRKTPGSEGCVDLYLMPAFDDIASLYFYDERWNVHYPLPDSQDVETIRDVPARPLTKEMLAEILNEMVQHAA